MSTTKQNTDKDIQSVSAGVSRCTNDSESYVPPPMRNKDSPSRTKQTPKQECDSIEDITEIFRRIEINDPKTKEREKITKVIINRVRKQLNNKTTEDLYRVGKQLKEFSQPPPAEPFISGEGVEKNLFQVAQYEQCPIYPIFDIYSIWLSKRLGSCHLDHFQETYREQKKSLRKLIKFHEYGDCCLEENDLLKRGYISFMRALNPTTAWSPTFRDSHFDDEYSREIWQEIFYEHKFIDDVSTSKQLLFRTHYEPIQWQSFFNPTVTFQPEVIELLARISDLLNPVNGGKEDTEHRKGVLKNVVQPFIGDNTDGFVNDPLNFIIKMMTSEVESLAGKTMLLSITCASVFKAITSGSKIWITLATTCSGMCAVVFRNSLSKFLNYINELLRGNRLQSEIDFNEMIKVFTDGVCLAMGKGVATMNILSRSTMFFAQFGRIKEGVLGMIDFFLSLAQHIVNFFAVTCMGGTPIILVTDLTPKIITWCATINEQIKKLNEGEFELVSRNAALINSLEQQGLEFCSDKALLKSSMALRSTITIHLSALKKLKDVCQNIHLHGNNLRSEPVLLYIYGKTGTGKSFMTAPLVNEIMLRVLSGVERQDFLDHYIDHVYAVNPEIEYMTGFHGQSVLLYDDFGQKVDSSGNPNKEYFDIIRTANLFPYVAEMADIESKGKMQIAPKLVVATSNLEDVSHHVQSIVDKKALERRFDYRIEVIINDSYKGHKDSVLSESFDVANVKISDEHFDWSGFSYKVFKNTDNKDTFEIYTFEELAKLVAARIIVKQQAGDVYAEKLRKLQISVMNEVDPGWSPNEIKAEFQSNFSGYVVEDELNMEDVDEILSHKALHEAAMRKAHQVIHYNVPNIVQDVESDDSSYEDSASDDDDPYPIGNPIIIERNFKKALALEEFDYEDIKFISYKMTVRDQKKIACLFRYLGKRFSDQGEVPTDESITRFISALSRTLGDFYNSVLHSENGNRLGYHYATWYKRHRSTTSRHKFEVAVSSLKYGQMNMILDKSTIYLKKYYDMIKDSYENFIIDHPLTFACLKYLAVALGFVGSCYGLYKIMLFMIPSFKEISFIKELFEGDVHEFNDSGEVAIRFKEDYKNAPGVFANENQPQSQDKRLDNKHVLRRSQRSVAPRRHRVVFQNRSDQTCDDMLMNVVKNHLYEIYPPRSMTKMGYALAIGGKKMLTCYHFTWHLKRLISENRFTIEDKCILRNPFLKGRKVFEISVKELLKYADMRSNDFSGVDAFVFKMGSTFNEHRDISKYFMTEESTTQIDDKFDVRVLFKREDIVWCAGTEARHFSTMKIDDGHNPFVMDVGYAYEAGTVAGDCGGIIAIVDSAFTNGKLIGIHTSGTTSTGCGFATGISYEDILALSACVEKSETPQPQVNAEDIANEFTIIERIPKPLRAPGKTKIIKSELHGLWIPSAKAPALLRPRRYKDGSVIDPYLKRIKVYLPKECSYDSVILDRAFSDLKHFFMKQNIITRHNPKVLTFEQAIMGVPGKNYCDSLPRGTSSGYPYNTMNHPGFSGKEWFFGKEERFDLSRPQCVKLKHRVLEIIGDARFGIRSKHVYSDNLKDELRTFAKVEKGDTRIFSGSPIDYCISVRMMFLDFSMWMMENRIFLESCVGVNPYSHDWDNMARRLQQFGGTHLLAGDFKAFDASLRPEIIMKICDVINSWYNDCEENQVCRRILFMDIAYSKHVYGDFIFQWNFGMPSGNPLTTIINCLYNCIAFRYCWYSCIKHDGVKYNEPFDKYVKLEDYGDDNLCGVCPAVAHNFNGVTIEQFMSELGLTYTRADKASGFVEFETIETVSFLSRSYSFDQNLNKWLCPLKLSTVLELPYWTKIGKHIREITSNNVENCLIELSLHNDEVWNEYAPQIISSSIKYLSYYPKETNRNTLRKNCVLGELENHFIRGYICDQEDSYKIQGLKGFSELYVERAVLFNSDATGSSEQPSNNPGALGAAIQVGLPDSVRFQSANNNIESDVTSVQQQGKTLNFHDDGDTPEVRFATVKDINPSLMKSTKDANEYDVKDFLARPIPVISQTWSSTQIANTPLISLKVPVDVIKYQQYFAKLQGFLGFKATLCLRLQVNTNRFQQGRLLCYYFPKDDENPRKYLSIISKLQYKTQLPRVEFDAAIDSDVIMKIPYINESMYFNLATNEARQGTFDVCVYQPLNSAAGELDAQMSLFAWFEDIDITYATIPTAAQPQAGGDPQVKERKKDERPISEWLGASSRLAKAAGAIPLLSSVSGPVSWVLAMAQKAAFAWGFSNPIIMPSIMNINQKLMPYGANSSGQDNSYNVALTQENSLEMLPGFSGTDLDEMSFSHILSVGAYVDKFNWAAQGTGTQLYVAELGPLSNSFMTTNTVTYNTYTMKSYDVTPMGYVAPLFTQWRGSFNFKFKMVKTEFHSGKLMVAFVPHMAGTGSTYPYSNMTYTHREIFDIRDGTEFNFCCPWVSTTPYKKIYGGSNLLNTNNNTEDTCMGRLFVYVVNELRYPSSVTSSIDVLIEMSAGEDFEFACPCDTEHTPWFAYTTAAAATGQTNLAAPVFQAGEFEGDDQAEPQEVRDKGAIGGTSIVHDDYAPSKYCVGEKILSCRQLVKRAAPYITIGDSSTAIGQIGGFIYPYSCVIPALNNLSNGSVGFTFNVDLVSYFSALFGYYRGSMRLKSYALNVTDPHIRMHASPTSASGGAGATFNRPFLLTNYASAVTDVYSTCFGTTTSASFDTANEIQIPYYNATYMSPVVMNSFGGSTLVRARTSPSIAMQIKYNNSNASTAGPHVVVLRQAADDFSFGFFTGTMPLISNNAPRRSVADAVVPTPIW